MKLRILAAGTRMPGWVTQGFDEYTRRMPPTVRPTLAEIGLGRRTKSGHNASAVNDESRRMLGAVKDADYVVALAVEGRALSTAELASRLAGWLRDGRDLAFLIGGPDGLAPDCMRRAEFAWSLSPLTLPHGLVRVVLAEQLYRAWSVLEGHPYHRA